MHRPLPPPERRLQRATWVVLTPFAFAGAQVTWRPPRPAAFVVVREYDSAFRVWRILGGGKMRQTLCVLNLAKILLNNSFYFIQRRPKIF